MQHFKTLRTRTKFAISLIFGLVFALVTFGCEADKNASEFSVTAEGTSEGILLHFDNISEDATWLAVTMVDITTDDNDLFNNHIGYSNIGFDKNDLAKLRELNNFQNFLYPFVIDGHEYEIYIHYDDNDYPIILKAVAGGGISLTNEPRLYFNEEKNGLILSVKPAFSDGVLYPQDHNSFSYSCLGIKPDSILGKDIILCHASSSTNDLICDVSVMYNFENNDYQELKVLTETENFSLFGAVYCFVDYGNFLWSVKAAKTEEVIVGL